MTLIIRILRCSRRLLIILISYFMKKCLLPLNADRVSCPALSKNLWRSLNARLVTRPNGHSCKVVGVTNGCIAVQLCLALRRFFWQNTLSHDFGCGVSILGTNFGLFFFKVTRLRGSFYRVKKQLDFSKNDFLVRILD